MMLSYCYKLKPSKAQYGQLAQICEAQRLLYNAALEERGSAWRKAGRTITKHDQNRSLTEIRAFDDAYAAMPVAVSRWSLARVDDALSGFFRRVKQGQSPGYPRFRSKGRWRSFGFCEFRGIRLRSGRLLFKPLIGALRVHMHRPMPDGADIKSCTFTLRGRHWFIRMVVAVPQAERHPAPGSVIGLDVGITHLATTSSGQHIANIRPLSRRERELRLAYRALARCKRTSKRRLKACARLATIQRQILQARNAHLHKVSADLTGSFELIAVEDLNLKNLTKSAAGTVDEPGKNVRQKAGLNRALQDAAPGRLIQLLSYKAERAGGTLVKVDPRGTSQECSSCGTKVEKSLSMRVHRCICGADLDRDHNAALNILNRALVAHGRAKPPGDGNVGHQPVRRLVTAVADAA